MLIIKVTVLQFLLFGRSLAVFQRKKLPQLSDFYPNVEAAGFFATPVTIYQITRYHIKKKTVVLKMQSILNVKIGGTLLINIL
jgi:hypothetical protein